MVMGRRQRKTCITQLRDAIWPRHGVKRGFKYLAHRVARLPGTPYSIAAGFAAGAAVSFTPFLGLHFILGAFLALAIGGNLIASAIGTAIGNPWTFPFIWSLIYSIGSALVGTDGKGGAPVSLTMHNMFNQPMDILYPMVVGATPVAPFVWALFFLPVYAAVRRYQFMRRTRRQYMAGRRRQRTPNGFAKARGERG